MRSAGAIAALGLTLVAVALVFDAEVLSVPGVGLVALALGGLAWVRRAAGGASVRREVPVRRVEEDEAVSVAVEVASARGPLPGGVVEDPLVAGPMPVRAGARAARMRINVRFARRGRRVLPPPVLRLRDPLGLASRTVPASGPDDEIVVLPRTSPVAVSGDSGVSHAVRAVLTLTAAATELDGLRPYRDGAPAGRIHWPAVARGAGLVEKRMRADADSRPLVVLDARAAASQEDEDAAVRAAASLVLALARRGGCALLLGGERRAAEVEADLAAWPALHARLALADGSAPAPTPAAAGAQRRGAVFYVSARRVRRAPRGWAQAARGGHVLVVPSELAGRRPAFAVAGCWGYVDAPARVAVPA